MQQLGREISAHYRYKEVIALAVMNGAMLFAADLVRQLDVDVALDSITVRSYEQGTVSPGSVELLSRPTRTLSGKHVLLIEDIVDTGHTLNFLKAILWETGPATVSCVSLLNKPVRRQTEAYADFIGFDIDDVFVVGYGLDLDGRYRNLPYVGWLPSL